MIKTVFTCALLAFASAQNLQDLANQANTAVAPTVNQLSQADSSLTLNEYEWVVTEQGTEYELNVNLLSASANNVAPALAALLANVGNAVQNNANTIENVLETGAQNLGVTVEDNGALANAATQYGAQLSENAESLTTLAEDNYNQVAAALAANPIAVNEQVTQQINQAVQNPESLSTSVNDVVNQAVEAVNTGNLENLGGANVADVPVQVNGDVASLTSQAVEAASNVNTNQAVESLGDYANQALNAGNNVAATNVPSNVVSAANNVANSAVQTAANGLNTAANTQAINNLVAVANLANGAQ